MHTVTIGNLFEGEVPCKAVRAPIKKREKQNSRETSGFYRLLRVCRASGARFAGETIPDTRSDEKRRIGDYEQIGRV